MKQYELIIFDCDGVLLDSEIIACRAEAEALTREGIPFNAEDVLRRFTGMPSQEMYRILERETGTSLPKHHYESVRQTILERYRSELQAVPGASDVLQSLTIPKCVASSASPTKLALGLVETDLYDLLYPHIYSTYLVAQGKPAPDLFLYAAKQSNVTTRDCLVVEDSVPGVTAAVAAGMDCIGFVGGSHARPDLADRLISAGANSTVSDLKAILRLV
ncbi:MAG: HAD family hydrolase [Pseudomonadota bacterium]